MKPVGTVAPVGRPRPPTGLASDRNSVDMRTICRNDHLRMTMSMAAPSPSSCFYRPRPNTQTCSSFIDALLDLTQVIGHMSAPMTTSHGRNNGSVPISGQTVVRPQTHTRSAGLLSAYILHMGMNISARKPTFVVEAAYGAGCSRCDRHHSTTAILSGLADGAVILLQNAHSILVGVLQSSGLGQPLWTNIPPLCPM